MLARLLVAVCASYSSAHGSPAGGDQFGCPETANPAAEKGFLVTNNHEYLGLAIASYSDYYGTYKATCTSTDGFTLPPGASGYVRLDGSAYTVNPKWKVPNYGGGWSTVISAPLQMAYLNYCTSGNESAGTWEPSALVFGTSPRRWQNKTRSTARWCDDNKQCEAWPGTYCSEDTTGPDRPYAGMYTTCQFPNATRRRRTAPEPPTTSKQQPPAAVNQFLAPPTNATCGIAFPRNCSFAHTCNDPGKPFPYSCSCPESWRVIYTLGSSPVVEVEGEGIFATCRLDGICRRNWEGLIKLVDDDAVAHARSLQGTGRLGSGTLGTTSTSISFVRHNSSSSDSTGCGIRTMFIDGAREKAKLAFAVAPIDPMWCEDEGRHIAAVHNGIVARRDPKTGALSFFELQFDTTHTKVNIAHIFDMDEQRSATVAAMELSDCGIPAPCPDPATCPVRLCFFVIGTTLVEMRRTAIDTKETIYEGIPVELAFGAHRDLPLYRRYVAGYFSGFIGIALNTTAGSICSTTLEYGMRGPNATHIAYADTCRPDQAAFSSQTDWAQVGFVQDNVDVHGDAAFYEWTSNEGISFAEFGGWDWQDSPRTWHPFPRDPETSMSFIPRRPDWFGTNKRAVLLNFYN